MSLQPRARRLVAELSSRGIVAVRGPDWRGFLQGLLSQDVENLAKGGLRFGALLTPQGRLACDLFILGEADGCALDCAADRREALIQKLRLYRLRAKVEIEAADGSVRALYPGGGVPPDGGWAADPRLPTLGWRSLGEAAPPDAKPATEADYTTFARGLGVPCAEDFGEEATYPLEANLDLLNGIDFKKGCFVGQETTSRMKRRGQIKSRMVPIAFEGQPPSFGAELLAGDLRCGAALSGGEGLAMALLRLDRLDAGPLTMADGRPWSPRWPAWFGDAPTSSEKKS